MFFEDFRPGDETGTRSLTVTKEEILSFARQFDPQPFHVDEEAARQSPYGGLIASGWHTAALCMRLIVELLGAGSGSLGSPGVDELRWLKPVRPGDELSVRVEVMEANPSRSKPDRGLVKLRYTMRNQNGEDVMTMIALGLVLRRPDVLST
jgi:acyl dehydratase